MGKQFEAFGFDIVIRTKDHEPPHVHAIRGRDRVKIDLDPVKIKDTAGRVTRREAAQIRRAVIERREELLEAWRRIHGKKED